MSSSSMTNPMDLNLSAGSAIISQVKTFFNGNQDLSQYVDMIRLLDEDQKMQGAIRQIKPIHFRVSVATLFLQELIKLLYLLRVLYGNTPSFRKLYTSAREVKDQFRFSLLNVSWDTSADLMTTFQGFTNNNPLAHTLFGAAGTSVAAAAAAIPTVTSDTMLEEVDPDFDCICDKEYEEEQKKKGSTMVGDDELDYEFLEDFENDTTLTDEEKDRKRRDRVEKELLLQDQYEVFMQWVNCFYDELKSPERVQKLKNHDVTLFTSGELKWLTPKRFTNGVDPNLSDVEYPHNAEMAIDEMRFFDDDREEDKRRLPRVWSHLTNLMLLAQFLDTVTNETIQELLDKVNSLIDDFLNGKIKDIATINEQLTTKIQEKLPHLQQITNQLKDLIFATVFHNIDKFRKQLKNLKERYGSQVADWATQMGVNLDLNKLENVFETRVVKQIVSFHQTGKFEPMSPVDGMGHPGDTDLTKLD